jgi:hypothetical protein
MAVANKSGVNAPADYDAPDSPDVNYQALMAIYNCAVAVHREENAPNEECANPR